MAVLIGADFVSTISNHDLFASADIKTLLGDEQTFFAAFGIY